MLLLDAETDNRGEKKSFVFGFESILVKLESPNDKVHLFAYSMLET